MQYSKGTYKIHLSRSCLKFTVQNVLFRHGCKWMHGSTELLPLSENDDSFIFINNGIMVTGSYEAYNNSNYKTLGWLDVAKEDMMSPSKKNIDNYKIF